MEHDWYKLRATRTAAVLQPPGISAIVQPPTREPSIPPTFLPSAAASPFPPSPHSSWKFVVNPAEFERLDPASDLLFCLRLNSLLVPRSSQRSHSYEFELRTAFARLQGNICPASGYIGKVPITNRTVAPAATYTPEAYPSYRAAPQHSWKLPPLLKLSVFRLCAL